MFGLKVCKSAVAAGVTDFLRFHELARTIAGDDGKHGFVASAARAKRRENILILSQDSIKRFVGFNRTCFDIDEQRELSRRAGIRVNKSGILLYAFSQRIQIKAAKSSLGRYVSAVVSNIQIVIDEEDIRLDAVETLIERIIQRSVVLVVIVGMSP